MDNTERVQHPPAENTGYYDIQGIYHPATGESADNIPQAQNDKTPFSTLDETNDK